MPQQLDSQVAAILQARHDNPFSFLGMHHCGDGICVRAILPDAQQMAVVDSATGNIAAEGNAVIVGRGGPWFLRDREDTFRVFTYAPREEKIRRLAVSLSIAHLAR